MAREKLSNFWYHNILDKFFPFFLAHKVNTNHEQKISSDLEAEAGSHRCCLLKNIQNLWGGAQHFPRHATCQRSHELIASSRLWIPPLLSMLLWLVVWRGQHSCTLSYISMHGQQLFRRLEVYPGSLLRIRLSWLLCVRSRQALLMVELLLLVVVLEVVQMKSPPLEPLSTKDTRV